MIVSISETIQKWRFDVKSSAIGCLFFRGGGVAVLARVWEDATGHVDGADPERTGMTIEECEENDVDDHPEDKMGRLGRCKERVDQKITADGQQFDGNQSDIH